MTRPIGKALARALRDRGQLVTTAATLQEAVACASARRPEFLLVDLKLGIESGLNALTAVRACAPAIRALVHSGVRSSGASRTERSRVRGRAGMTAWHWWPSGPSASSSWSRWKGRSTGAGAGSGRGRRIPGLTSISAARLKVAGALGLRFDLKTRERPLNLRIDLAGSSSSYGFYVNLGEAF
jgi:CheY-like chemotaxis protein